MIKRDIILIGGGGHCKSCIDVIELEGKYNILGILDIPEFVGTKILNYEVIGSDDDFPEFAKSVKNYLVTIGQIKTYEKRKQLFKMVKKSGANLPSIISPMAYVSKTASIGEGSIVMHHAIINTSAHIGVNSIINTKALIEHDAIIGDHCHISTASVINGNVVVGSGVFVGSGAITVQGTKLPEDSFVKAGGLFIRR